MNFLSLLYWQYLSLELWGSWQIQVQILLMFFLYFLNELWKEIYEESNQNNETYWLIMDNASIHKTNEVRTFFINKCFHAVTIPPYNPALNAAEIVIQAIKAKIKQRRAEGRQAKRDDGD